jgi:uncharacterized protein YggE
MLMSRLASIVLLPLAAAACSQPADPRGVDRGETLLQVAASGRADTRPDEARFTAGVETIAPTAAAASAATNAAINRVMRSLEGLGVKPDDVQTRSVTLARIDYGKDRGRYRAHNLVEIRVRDIAKAGAAIAAATDAGANVLSGPDLRIGDPEKANRAAYTRAYRAARARADAYAEAAGLEVKRVLAIRDSAAGRGPVPYYGEGDAANEVAQGVAPPPINPGLTTSEVSVSVDFALGD